MMAALRRSLKSSRTSRRSAKKSAQKTRKMRRGTKRPAKKGSKGIMNSWMRKKEAARKANAKTFKYKGKTYKQKKLKTPLMLVLKEMVKFLKPELLTIPVNLKDHQINMSNLLTLLLFMLIHVKAFLQLINLKNMILLLKLKHYLTINY